MLARLRIHNGDNVVIVFDAEDFRRGQHAFPVHPASAGVNDDLHVPHSPIDHAAVIVTGSSYTPRENVSRM